MGEYAYYKGERVKIGTCEDMLYLRWDQRDKVERSETPLFDPAVLAVIRFRFPWPEEDGVEPGGFEDPFRGLTLWGFEQPAFEHGLVQFSATNGNGYLVSLPCPEGPSAERGYTVHRNGYGGPARLVGQAWRNGQLVGIAQCNGCGYPYRLEDGYQDAAAVAIRSEADRQIRTAEQNCTEGNRQIGERLHTVADRLLAGYPLPAAPCP